MVVTRSSGTSLPLRSDSKRTQAAILETALAVLAERPRASLEEIAQVVGINRSTVHRHFARREDLIDALWATMIDQYDAAHAESRAEGGTAAEQIERMQRRNVLLGDRTRFLLERWDEFSRIEHFKSRDSWRALIAEAKRDGAIRADLPEEWINRLIAGILLATLRLVDEGFFSSEQAAELAPRTIMKALAPDGPRR